MRLPRPPLAPALLACVILYGPERFPIDEIIHQEFRVKLCQPTQGYTAEWGPTLVVESRTYERVRVPGGYQETPISSGPDGWRNEKTIPLYLSITSTPAKGGP